MQEGFTMFDNKTKTKTKAFQIMQRLITLDDAFRLFTGGLIDR